MSGLDLAHVEQLDRDDLVAFDAARGVHLGGIPTDLPISPLAMGEEVETSPRLMSAS